MKRRLTPFVPFLLCLSLCLALTTLFFPTDTSVQAQTYLNAWRTFDPFDGAIGNWFWTATQTPDNAIWFGTDRGVLRYDGLWRAYGEAEGLPAGSVRTLLLDRSGRLWATTRQGVAYLDGERWVVEGEAQGLAAQAFLSLIELPDGTLWAGSVNGLFARNPTEGLWQAVSGVPVVQIDALALTADGAVWLASANRLFRREGGHWREIPLDVNGNPLSSRITALAPADDGSLWVATSGHGVAHLFPQLVRWYDRRNGLPEDNVLSLLVTREGDVWVGTNGGGVGYWHQGEWSQLDFTDGLAANFVTTIFRDRDGMMWFGTVAGISRYDTRTWTTWEDNENAPLTRILTLLVDDRGQVWAGTYGEGLFRFDGTRWASVTVLDRRNGLPVLYFESSFQSADGALWFGSNGYGVIRYRDGLIEQWTTADGLAHDQVVAIAQTPDGAMWFGLLDHGLSRWDGQTWKQITTADGLIADEVQALQVDGQGRLWVGTAAGVSMYDGAWHSYTAEDGLAAADVNDIALARDGSLWFATWGGGVSRLHEGRWTTYTTADGLLAPGVDAVWADPHSDRVWFGTVSGLCVFDGQTWQSYGVAQGIGVGRVYEVVGSADDGIYLGTETGVVRFHPDRTPPQVRIAAVNGLMPSTTTVSISPDDFLRIGWEGHDLVTASGALFYQYRLHGYDADWHQTRTPMATYSPLPEGAYRFEVQARDTGLNYSESVFLDLIVKRPPSTIWVPWVGPVRAELVLIGVALATVFVLVSVYAVWSTLTRLAMSRQAVERRFNPYVAGAPIRDAAMFYGREALLREIVDAVHHNSLMIHGERRIGKTSLLYQIQKRLQGYEDAEYHFFPVYIDLEGTPEPEFFHRLMEGVLEALAEPLQAMENRQELHYYQKEKPEAYEDRDFRRDLRLIIDFLKERYHRQPRLIFLLDEIDILNSYDQLTQQQLRRILQDAFAQNVSTVVAGVHISKSWDRQESPWYNMFVEVPLPPFDRKEAEKLMREPVARFYKWEDDAIHYVYARSQGRPHRIQQICLEAVNSMLDDHRKRITLEDVKKAYERIIANDND